MSIHTDSEAETAEGTFGYTDLHLFKFMLSYGLKHKKKLIYLLAFMFVNTFTISTAPILLLIAIDSFNAAVFPLFGIDFIDNLTYFLVGFIEQLIPNLTPVWYHTTVLSLYYLVLQLALVYASYRQAYLLGEISNQATYELRNQTFAHLQEMDMSYHDKNEVGRILSRTTTDILAIGDFIGGEVFFNVINLFTVFVVFIIMVSINLFLALISVIIILPVIILSTISKNIARPRRKETRRTNAKLMANLAENIAGIKVTKGMQREIHNIHEFEQLNEDRRYSMVKAIDVNVTFFPLMLFLSSIATALIILIGGFQLNAGVLTIGTLFTFINYNVILLRPIVILGNFYEQIQDALTGAERVLALLETDTKVPFKNEFPKLPEIVGNVKFDNVSFSYDEKTAIYQNFNLDISSGKKIALVGQTGAGKTTIINMLSRLYSFQDGVIWVDGKDIRKFSLVSYRNQVIAVPQDSFLFRRSIRENLKLGNPNATDTEMWDALDKSGIKNYIERLPQQLDTEIQERGSKFSIGQRQLLLFAAVFLSDPRILILDEATSSIDVFTEIQIQKSMQKILKNRTTFIIAHRLSTIKDADLICVIDNGSIIEQGTHDTLMGLSGKYYSLVKHQIALSNISQTPR